MKSLSYRALLRKLLAPAPVEPAPCSDFPPMRVIRLGRVLSDGAGR